MDDSHEEAIVTTTEVEVLQQPTPPSSDAHATGSTETHITEQPNVKRMDIDEEAAAADMLSPMSTEGDKQDEAELPAITSTDLGSPSMGYDFSNIRVCIQAPIRLGRTKRHCANRFFSSCHHLLPHFFVPAANSMEPSNRNGKFTTCKWKSNM